MRYPLPLVSAAKDFLRVLLAGKHKLRPSDIDEVLVGRMQDPFGMLLAGPPITPFTMSLREMMDSGEVKAGQDAHGWWYRLARAP